MEKPEEQQMRRGGISNYYYGGVRKVVNVSVNKDTLKDLLGFVTKPKREKTHTEEETCDEELFHFIHPEVEHEEAVRIHQAIKRAVAYLKAPEICAYLKELKQKGKVMLPPSPSIMYNELVRMGMPTDKGFSEKYFSSCYIK